MESGRQEINGQPTGLYEWALRRGFQRFFQPHTIAPQLMNAKGWIDIPRVADLVIDLYSVPPTESKTMYWFYESIVTMSPKAVRLSLEGNHTYDANAGRFHPAGWRVNTGYVVRDDSPHRFVGAFIKTTAGEAMRLRIHAQLGAISDLHFKLIGVELPFAE